MIGGGLSLGIDVGTSGVRASVLSADGTAVGRAGLRYQALGVDPRDPAAWWAAVQATLLDLGTRTDLDGIRAVAVDGTSGTMLAVDEAGEPVGPAFMYGDPCPDDALVARIDGLAPAASAARGRTSALARAILLQDRPGAARCLHQADWIAGRLAGRFDVSDDNNALKTGWDPVALAWPDWIADAGARVDMLPSVLRPGDPVGPVGPEGRALGLPESATVHAGTTDGCASFLATGAAEIGDAVTALGSTLVIKLLSDRPVSSAEAGVYSHRIGDRWLVGGASNTGGAVIAALFPDDRLPALTAALRPAAPTGLDYYPLLRPGERFPISDPALPPRLEPRPADEAVFFQAVLEGIAAVEALAYRRLAQLGAPALRSVRTVGGGSANPGWTAIRRDRLGVPFEPSLSEEASDGVARLALARIAAME